MSNGCQKCVFIRTVEASWKQNNYSATYKICILAMQSVDSLKRTEGALTVSAAQSHSKQDDYLPMTIPTKFTEASALVMAKAEFRVQTHHECELWSSCLPPRGVEALHGMCMPDHSRGRMRAAALHARGNQDNGSYRP